MTREETARLLALVTLNWPHSNIGGEPEIVLAHWHDYLATTDYADAEGVLRELATSGREHAPPVGLVVKLAVERALNLPDWDQAWQEIDRKVGECITPHGYRIPKADEFSHPYIGEFARANWRDLCPPPEQSGMATHRAQMRDAYYAGGKREQRDEALSRVGAGRNGEPRRLDGQVALPSGP